MTSDEECPHCGAGGFNTYCWDCGYDAELEPDLIDQVDDGFTDSEFEPSFMQDYDEEND